MSAKSSFTGVRIVTAATVEAARLIREVAPARDGENVKSRITTAANRLRWKWSRAKAVWHADGRVRIRVEELDQLRKHTAKAEMKAASNELQELRDTVARLMGRLDRIDADFYGPTADALRDQVRGLDGTSRPVDRA